ncbi:MAG: extracellular solute-binding protein [Thermomicrobiales bacterium]
MNANREQGLNRRQLVGGMIAGAAALQAGGLSLREVAAQDATPITEDVGTPPEGTFKSLHELPLSTSGDTFKLVVADVGQPRFDQDNETTTWMEQNTGIKIEWTIVPGDNALEQMQLILAGGDLPDAFFAWGYTPLAPTQVNAYGDQGFFIDLSDKLEANAPNFLALSKDWDASRQMVTSPDGKIFGLPAINDCYHCSMPQKFWINQEWLTKLNLQIPKTPDEMKTVLTAFKEGDPNGNGKPIYPISVSTGTGLGDLDAFLMNPFQFSPGDPWLYLDDDNTVTAAFIKDGWKEGIKYLADLYANGLIDPDSFTQTSDQMYVKTKNPEYPGIGGAPSFWKATFIDFNSPFFKQYQAIPQLTGPTGLQQTTRGYYSIGSVGGIQITSASKNPELLLKWADNMYGHEQTKVSDSGTPGKGWRWAKPGELGIDGKPAITFDIKQPEGLKPEPTNWWGLGSTWRSSVYRFGSAVSGPRDENTETILYDATKEFQEPYAVPRTRILPTLSFSVDQSAQLSLSATNIGTLVKQRFANWVTGQGNPDDEWAAYLDELKSVGFEEYLKTYQDAWSQSPFNPHKQ